MYNGKKRRIRSRRRKNTDGGRIRHIDSRPPDFISAPWYNLTVRIDNPGTTLTTTVLSQALSSQLGFTTPGGVSDVRLQSVRIWGALVASNATNPLQRVTVIINDPIGLDSVAGTGTGSRVLEQITDYPDQVNRAAIGYVYPKAQREFSLRIGVVPVGVLINSVGLGPNSVIYFNLQWRTGLQTPPAILDWNEAMEEEEESDVEIIPKPKPRSIRSLQSSR
jgi:hypothetical protein